MGESVKGLFCAFFALYHAAEPVIFQVDNNVERSLPISGKVNDIRVSI